VIEPISKVMVAIFAVTTMFGVGITLTLRGIVQSVAEPTNSRCCGVQLTLSVTQVAASTHKQSECGCDPGESTLAADPRANSRVEPKEAAGGVGQVDSRPIPR